MEIDNEIKENFDKLFDKLEKLCDKLEKDIKDRENRNMNISNEIELGKEVYLTDPCYDTSSWCQDLLHNVKKWYLGY